MYESTIKRNYWCAFRCAHCGKINVTKGELVTKGAGATEKQALASSIKISGSVFAKLCKRVNEEHKFYQFKADAKCAYCGREQEWKQDKNAFLLKLALMLAVAFATFAILFVFVRTLDLMACVMGSLVAAMVLYPLYGYVVQRAWAHDTGTKMKPHRITQNAIRLSQTIPIFKCTEPGQERSARGCLTGSDRRKQGRPFQKR